MLLYKYNPVYKRIFREESNKIANILGGNCLIEHIGSTAVPELDGKGVIDIMIAFKDTDEQEIAVLLLENYYHTSDGGDNGRIFMTSSGEKESQPGDIHLHLVLTDSENLNNAILFRNYLIQNPEAKRAYSDLKYKICQKVGDDRAEYTRLKSSFINEIIAKAKNQIISNASIKQQST